MVVGGDNAIVDWQVAPVAVVLLDRPHWDALESVVYTILQDRVPFQNIGVNLRHTANNTTILSRWDDPNIRNTQVIGVFNGACQFINILVSEDNPDSDVSDPGQFADVVHDVLELVGGTRHGTTFGGTASVETDLEVIDAKLSQFEITFQRGRPIG